MLRADLSHGNLSQVNRFLWGVSVCVCVLSEQSELKLWLHSEDLLWNTESLTDHIIISMQSLNMCNVQTHSNSCVNVSSHEYVSRPIKFEIIQTVLLNKLYTKQSSPLIFWQTLAIVLRNVEGSHTHILVSYFPHPRLWVAKHTHEKPQRGPSLWILGHVPFSSTSVIGPDLHQSVQASNALVCPTISTHPLNQCLKRYHSCWHTHA